MTSGISLDFAILDVFTQRRYQGNPLAIVRVPESVTLSQAQKQNIAREFNLSETTFLHEHEGVHQSEWTVDIFTVDEELPFAGHPTIGTACFVLSNRARDGDAEGDIEASFNLKAGPVELQYNVGTAVAKAEIPHNVCIHKRTISQDDIRYIQPGLQGVHLNESFPIVSIVKGMTFVLIELEDLEALGRVGTTGVGLDSSGLEPGWSSTFFGTYFFVETGRDADGATTLRTRMIERTLEDPATGSAASDLAAYLSLVRGKPGETIDYAVTQGVEMGRRSEIRIQVVMGEDGSGIDKIVLGGSSVRTMEGRLTVQ